MDTERHPAERLIAVERPAKKSKAGRANVRLLYYRGLGRKIISASCSHRLG
jgi:hypothetical protein